MSSSFVNHFFKVYNEPGKVQSSIILIRLLLSAVFITEGIQKFLFSDSLGVGRFIKIGIPAPGFFAPFVGVVEITCGMLILLGFFTSLAAVPLIINMSVAIWTTKVPILQESGFWKMAHEARTDWAMILGLIFLLFTGGGKWSLDHLRLRHSVNVESHKTQE